MLNFEKIVLNSLGDRLGDKELKEILQLFLTEKDYENIAIEYINDALGFRLTKM